MCAISKLHVHRKCRTPDDLAIVYIIVEGEKIGLCDKCWGKLANTDWEIGEGPKSTMEELISDKARGIEGAVETEFKYKGKKFDKENEDKEETLF